jgi:hypothetical protein
LCTWIVKKNQTFEEEQAQFQCVATDTKHKALKEDCNLFSQLFISCQSRQCDLREFFKFENQPFPAALSDNGKLHSCQKSDLVNLLVMIPDTEPEADAIHC